MNILKIITLATITLSFSCAEVGLTAGALLDTFPGARAEARGGAFVAASDVYSVNYNPGALADITNLQIGTMYIKGAVDTGYEYGAFVLPVRGLGVIGVSVFAFQGGSMEVVDALGNSVVKSAQNDYLFSGALGMKNLLLKNMNLGVTVKYLMSSLAETYNASTFTFDLGGTYKIEELTLGIAAYNLMGGLKYIDALDLLPVSARLGAEYLLVLGPDSVLTPSVDVSYNNERTVKLFMGLEYCYMSSLYGRIGYRLNDGDGGLGLGVGYRGTLLEDSVQSIDYAFIPSLNGLMDSHRISLSISFGEELKSAGVEKKKNFTPKRILK